MITVIAYIYKFVYVMPVITCTTNNHRLNIGDHIYLQITIDLNTGDHIYLQIIIDLNTGDHIYLQITTYEDSDEWQSIVPVITYHYKEL